MVSEPASTGDHWDSAYQRGEQTLSWYEPTPVFSLQMIDAAGLQAPAGVIDIGGGSSRLVDVLLECGFADLTVLDVSAAALEDARGRLGAQAASVQWLVEDIRAWRPDRRYQVWHDRAVFHFHRGPADRDAYLTALDAGTGPGSVAVMATFAPDGPTHCSGLPVARYSPDQLADILGAQWDLLRAEREEHVTPAGVMQPFTWALFRRR